jgi:hypothetical protein
MSGHPWYKGMLCGFESRLMKTTTSDLIYVLSQQIKISFDFFMFLWQDYENMNSKTLTWIRLNQTINGTFYFFDILVDITTTDRYIEFINDVTHETVTTFMNENHTVTLYCLVNLFSFVTLFQQRATEQCQMLTLHMLFPYCWKF